VDSSIRLKKRVLSLTSKIGVNFIEPSRLPLPADIPGFDELPLSVRPDRALPAPTSV